MRIKGDGNVGIGTLYADEKLAVNGTVHSKEVRVDLTGWNDYVFKHKYKLPLLADVKAYIDKNQHLPEIPSEAEMIKNGLNLGDMVKLQTKKIEELTLYLIEKDNRDKERDNKDKEKDAKLQSQQEQIDQLKQQLMQITQALSKK